jgi:ComF family protein
MCRQGLRGFDACYSYGAYEGSLRELIHLFKYSGVRPLARPLGHLLSLALPRDLEFDLIAPMPLHWRRLWSRGFNQSALLARDLARRTGVPYGRPVRRRRATVSQAELSGAERRRNVAGAFVVTGRPDVTGKRLLLVDDVLTTGATLGACAAALKKAGARYVTVLTLARVDRRQSALDFPSGAMVNGSS